MKIRDFCFLVFIIILLSTTRVSASSVNYELNIDDDRLFHETITYKIENNTTNDYLKSIISKPVYFDSDNTIRYTKKIVKRKDAIDVVLQYNYDVSLLNKSRIINECFDKPIVDVDKYHISFYANLPLKCSSVADDILIKITTNIDDLNQNADLVEDKTYIWNRIKDIPIFHMELGTIDPSSNVLPAMPCDNCENKYFYTIPENLPKYDINYIIWGVAALSSLFFLSIIIVTITRRKRSNNVKLIGFNYDK